MLDVPPWTLLYRSELPLYSRRHGRPGPRSDEPPLRIQEKSVSSVSLARLFRVNHDGFRTGLPDRNKGGELFEVRKIITWSQRINQHLHSSAADQTIIPTVVVVKLKRQQLGFTLIDQPQSTAFDLRFDTSAPQRSGLRSIRKDKHRRAGLLRRRPARFDKSGVGHCLPRLSSPLDVLKDLAHLR